MTPSLHQLKIFEAVAKHSNVTEASRELHISQPSVSQQLKLLEENFGVKLYVKTARGIKITKEGQLFLRAANPILGQVNELEKHFRSKLNERKAASLTVGGTHGPSVSFLPSLLTVFKETHPQVEVALLNGDSQALEDHVLKSEAEIALITNSSDSPFLIYEHCREEKVVPVVSMKHPLAKAQKLSLAELAGIPLIVKKGMSRKSVAEQILGKLEKQGIKLTVAMSCESPEAVKAFVKAGMGLGILYWDIAEPDIRRGDLKIINIPELTKRIDTFIIYQKQRPLSSNAQDFLTLLRQWQKKVSDWPLFLTHISDCLSLSRGVPSIGGGRYANLRNNPPSVKSGGRGGARRSSRSPKTI